MATKKQEEEAAKPVEVAAAPADPAPATEQVNATGTIAEPEVAAAPADPASATELVSASGAIAEPEVLSSVDLSHESADANPRAGSTSAQNNVDWNDAHRAAPNDAKFEGQGLDLSVYGKGAKT
ncbi:hypothetical protein ACEUZ9_000061 [Paracoccus litorisediminis]|uniref:hypothetical protein n=1 Tax=Paracoccus litorisediminis TaxID=2006130 RepID=UPI00372EB703